MSGNKSLCHCVLHFHRIKRKLLSTKMNDVWMPDTCKKSFVSVKRIAHSGKFSTAFDISVQNKMCITIVKFSFKFRNTFPTMLYFKCISEREQQLKRMLNLPLIEIFRLTSKKSMNTTTNDTKGRKKRKTPQVS